MVFGAAKERHIYIPSAAGGSPAQVLHLFLCNEPEAAWLNFCNISLPAQQEASLRWKSMNQDGDKPAGKSNREKPEQGHFTTRGPLLAFDAQCSRWKVSVFKL